MIRNLLVVAATLLLVSPISADSKCWMCDVGAEGATCQDAQGDPLARHYCEARRLCDGTGCRSLCATSLDLCSTQLPRDPALGLERVLFSAPSEIAERVAETFDSWEIGLLASRLIQERHLGQGEGLISLEDGQVYRFSGEVSVDRIGEITARYEVEDHPLFSAVWVGGSASSKRLSIVAERVDGAQRSETFLFEE